MRYWMVLIAAIAMPSAAQVSAGKASYSYTATTAAPPRTQGVVTASGIRWQCTPRGCTTAGPWAVPGVAACQALAREVGQITSYGHPGRQLSAKDLASCNQGLVAGAAAPAGQASRPVAPLSPTAKAAVVDASQLRQVINRRTQHYATLQQIRERAAAEARRREQLEEERKLAHSVRGEDCDDTRREVNPGAAETCDGLDNNCNGLVDEGQTLRRYLDADGDGHGQASRALDVCPADITAAARSAESLGGGWLVEVGNDCDDSDPARWRDCQ